MKVLIVGGGGREHALAWKIAQSDDLDIMYFAPGNAGTAELGENVPIQPDQIDKLLAFAQEKQIDLTIVGPEKPLVEGITDQFIMANLPVFGPDQQGARLEGSKLFAKRFMLENNIPTATCHSFRNAEEALGYVDSLMYPCVIKADGLAAGKGVIIAYDRETAQEAIHQMMVERQFGSAGEAIVVEQFLDGEEASILAITDGQTIVPLIPSQDHKRAYDGDRGPNTGGMGAYAPAPIIDEQMKARIQEQVLEPTLAGLQRRGMTYRGIIYVGLMIVDETPYVLEYNCRFGDPETQAVLPLIDSDLLEIMRSVANSEPLSEKEIRWKSQAALCIVGASEGYPGSYEKGKIIRGLDTFQHDPDVIVFHAGTDRKGDDVVTSGGRVLGVTALAETLEKAQKRAYDAIQAITYDGMFFRRDIGNKAFE